MSPGFIPLHTGLSPSRLCPSFSPPSIPHTRAGTYCPLLHTRFQVSVLSCHLIRRVTGQFQLHSIRIPGHRPTVVPSFESVLEAVGVVAILHAPSSATDQRVPVANFLLSSV